MTVKYIEENNRYYIDCTNAEWSTDEIHNAYHSAGLDLKDVDWALQDGGKLIMVEYKNSNIPNAANPEAFEPDQEKRIIQVAQKFYDSLHYLTMIGKSGTATYVYVLEAPNGDSVLRARIRNKLQRKLPFRLQDNLMGTKIIEQIRVVSIDEWNSDSVLGQYPILPVG